eukprot:3719945-Karenia_brevis.AAC.1
MKRLIDSAGIRQVVIGIDAQDRVGFAGDSDGDLFPDLVGPFAEYPPGPRGLCFSYVLPEFALIAVN